MPQAIGIDVGGTKIAAGLVDIDTGHVARWLRAPTAPERGGVAVLETCVRFARRLGGDRLPVGIGLCELVDRDGRPTSADTVDWRDLDVGSAIGAPEVVIESDVRAAALAEARFGAGAGRSPFLFGIVGTGASVCLVVDGVPHVGARGNALVLGAPPIEHVVSGPALARAAGRVRAEDVLADPECAEHLDEAASALGDLLAVLVNALDPALVVLGGGVGSQDEFCMRVGSACRAAIAYPSDPPLEVVPATLGPDAGIVGAALRAAEAS